MSRTTFATGLLLPTLLAALPACEDSEPPCTQMVCGTTCVDLMIDPANCGMCGRGCVSGETCVAGACQGMAACTGPEIECGGGCVDPQTSPAHCGDCATACSTGTSCVAGDCAEPLAVLQTSLMDGTVGRDAFVLDDVTFALRALNTTTFATGRVLDHAVLPDGRVILLAAETADVFELFLVGPRGGAWTRLSAPLATDVDVEPGFAVSADGAHVLYRATDLDVGVTELFVVAVASPGVAHKVNGALVTGGNVSRVFALSADGRRAAYVADQDTDGLDEAYTVDLTAATPGPSVKLNPVTTDAVWDLRLSGDGSRVVYRATDGATGRLQLNLVDVASPGTATPIAYADGAEGQVEQYQLSPTGDAVVFTGGNQFLATSLWRAPLAPLAEATRLVDGTGQLSVRADFALSADGARVYLRQVDGGYDRLFRVAVAAPLALTPLTPLATDAADEVTDFVVSPDERSVAYRAGADGAEGGISQPETAGPLPPRAFAPALYHLALGATLGDPTQLSPAIDVADEGIGAGYRFAGDGVRVLYRADHDQPTFADAYLASVATAGAPRKVSPPLDQTSDATDVSLITAY